MRRISEADVRGKKVLVRVDLNSPIEGGSIVPTARIFAHAITVRELSDRGAKVIVLAHQGRRGSKDFMSLEQHAKYFHKAIERDVYFVDDVIGENAKKAISRMEDGHVLLLDNVRQLTCETENDDGYGKIVHELSPLVDWFVLDALSVAHRPHSSVIGFCNTLPCFAGDVLSAEAEAVESVRDSRDVIFIFGGSKVRDSFTVMEEWLASNRAREILVGGALSILMLHASGKNVGSSMKYLEESGLLEYAERAKKLIDTYNGKIKLPLDVAMNVDGERVEKKVAEVDGGQIQDIGPKTTERYIEVINNSHAIVMNGPMGVYENEKFEKGTREILNAIAKCDAFSLLGGGHTLAAIEKFNIDKRYFSYVSLSGKALVEYLCGKELPGLRALEENEKKFPGI
ncbi:MAG: phosphoglycerate kinase [Candidatus Micrarchaeota archaeon]